MASLVAFASLAGAGADAVVAAGVLVDIGVDVSAEGEDGIDDEAPPHPDSVIAVGTAITVMSFVKFMC